MVYTQTITTKSPEETAKVGESMASVIKTRMLCLYGDLGSGKTTFTQGFARGLGITQRLLSPTFIIVRRYHIPGHSGFLYHLDLYRIQNHKELDSIGIREIFDDADSFVLIEWAERLGSLLPNKRIDVRFKLIDGEKHVITVDDI